MNTERLELDQPVHDRRKVSILRRPDKPTIWSMALSTKELVIVLASLLAALAVVLKFGAEFHWRFWAQEKVDAEVRVYTEPLSDRLKMHESAFVTKADFNIHLDQQEREVQETRTWRNELGQRIDFIYQEAYRTRFGSPPPRTNGRDGVAGNSQ